jgi:hypothetical protein
VTTTTRQVKDMPHALSQSEPADRVQMAGQQAARGGRELPFLPTPDLLKPTLWLGLGCLGLG